MNVDVEETLTRELREVADGIQVPTLPRLPQEPPHNRRLWQPLLAAAAVVLIVAGAVTLTVTDDDGRLPSPAPDPAKTPSAGPLTADPPTVPYLLDERVYVDGEQLPGRWWEMERAGDAWVAWRTNDSWWWGTDAEPQAIPGEIANLAHLSPDGTMLAFSTTEDGGQVMLLDTQSGETLGTLPTGMTNPRDSDAVGVIAVTDDAQVILDGGNEQLMWPGPDSDETVDLGETAPGQSVQGSTAAGLVVLDGTRNDRAYLAEVSDSGELSELRDLPGEEIVVNPSGTWLAHGGSSGGESRTIPYVTAESIDDNQRVRLRSPVNGRVLVAKTWEDDNLLLAELHDEGIATGLARCGIREERCVVLDVP